MNTTSSPRVRHETLHDHLTPLDWTLLRLLGQVDYASTPQLEQLALPGSSQQARARRLRRRLTHLYQHRLVYRLQRSIGGLGGGSRGAVWTLDQRGHRLLHQPFDDGSSVPRRRPARERGAAFLLHSLAVTQHLVDAHAWAATTDGVTVMSWAGEPACHVRYRDRSGRLAKLTPDALCEVRTPAEVIYSYLEIDRGTEGIQTLLAKAARYIAYAHRHPESPRTLWSFTTKERAQRFANALQRTYRQPAAHGLLLRGLFVITTADHAGAAICGEDPR